MNSSDFESMKKEFGHPPPKRSSNMASSSSSNKFQFKSLNGTTASNANGSSVRGKRCSDVFLVEDDLWCADDGIDDDFLLAASQMAENKNVKKLLVFKYPVEESFMYRYVSLFGASPAEPG